MSANQKKVHQKKTDVRVCHDRHGVELSVARDYMVLPLAEAERLAKELSSAVDEARSRAVLPAPEPLDFSDEFPGEAEFASVDPANGFETIFQIGGFEFGFQMAVRLHNWLGRAIEYAKGV